MMMRRMYHDDNVDEDEDEFGREVSTQSWTRTGLDNMENVVDRPRKDSEEANEDGRRRRRRRRTGCADDKKDQE